MSVDEIASRGERSAASRRRWPVALAVGCAFAVGWWALAGPAGDQVPTPPTGSSSPSPTATGPEQRPGIANARLTLAEVCPPVGQDAEHVLVPFVLENRTPAALVVVAAEAQTDRAGLVPAGFELVGGECTGGRRTIDGWIVQPGQSVLVTVRVRSVGACPARAPVGAVVVTRVYDLSSSGQLLRLDLVRRLSAATRELDSCSRR